MLSVRMLTASSSLRHISSKLPEVSQAAAEAPPLWGRILSFLPLDGGGGGIIEYGVVLLNTLATPCRLEAVVAGAVGSVDRSMSDA